MSWFTDPNCEAESLKEHVCMAYAVDFDFPSGHVRIGTWTGDLSVAANTYMGGGDLVSMSPVSEHADLTTERWTYQLSGVDPSIVPESEIDNCFGRPVVEYEVWIDTKQWTVIGYEINREGTMGRVRRMDGDSPLIEVSCESRLVVLERADAWRYTPEHQAKFFAGDKGCDFVRGIEAVDILWNGLRVTPGQLMPNIVNALFGNKS